MLSAAVLSLLLAAQQTPPAEADGPMATQRSTPRIPPGPPVDVNNLPIPQGAPSDDFGLVAWCHGALRGHMELAKQIDESDEEQEAIGREYLRGYDEALNASPRSRTTEGARAAAEAREAGYGAWAAARTAQNRETQKFTYLGWQLPGRCEHAAKRLASGADVLSAAMAAPARQAPIMTREDPPVPVDDPQTTP